MHWTELKTESIKKNVVGKMIEDYKPCWPYPDGNRRYYHAITRDYISNEIFRRIHPEKLTFGEYLNQTFRAKIGVQDSLFLQPSDE